MLLLGWLIGSVITIGLTVAFEFTSFQAFLTAVISTVIVDVILLSAFGNDGHTDDY